MDVETARSMLINDPGFWRQRAEEARRLAERPIDKTAKQTILMVAEVCDRFAIGAAMCSIYELALSRVIDETERELMLRECRLLASANPLMRF